MKELNIPEEHFSKFKFYATLPKEIKTKFLASLNSAPVGLSPTAMVDYLSNNIENLSKDKISDIFNIFINLIRAKENIGGDLPDFIQILSFALSKSGVEELTPSDELLNEFKDLISSGNNLKITSKVIDIMSDNQKTYIDSKIYQDIRFVFGDDDELAGSAIIHKLKIRFREDNEIKETYFSLDDNDVENLISLLKNSQEKTKFIKTHFNNAKIVEIK